MAEQKPKLIRFANLIVTFSIVFIISSLAFYLIIGEDGGLLRIGGKGVGRVGDSLFLGFALSIIVGIPSYFIIFVTVKLIAKNKTKEIKSERLYSEAEELQNELGDNFFNNFVKLNFKYLDSYYLQTQVQADKGFFITTLIAILSFIIISIGIVAAFFDAAADAARLSVIAGTLGEFIAGIFFYLYNKTVSNMGEYHRRLTLTQNIGIALQVSEGLPEEIKNQTKKDIISSLLLNINEHLSSASDAANSPNKKIQRTQKDAPLI